MAKLSDNQRAALAQRPGCCDQGNGGLEMSEANEERSCERCSCSGDTQWNDSDLCFRCTHPEVGYLLPKGYRISIARLCKHCSPKPSPSGFEEAWERYAGNSHLGYSAGKAMYSKGKADDRLKLIGEVKAKVKQMGSCVNNCSNQIRRNGVIDILDSLEEGSP